MGGAWMPRQQGPRIEGRRTPVRASGAGRATAAALVAAVILAFGATAAVAAAVAAPAPVAAPADPGFAQQWGLDNRGQGVLGRRGTPGADVRARTAWSFTRGAGATVGVVDSGVDAATGVRLGPGGIDLVDGASAPNDRFGHGVAISSIIAAPIDAAGVVGLAPEASVVGIRVLDASGRGSVTTLAAGLARAGDLGLRVVNASVSGDDSPALEAAIADHPDTLYVVAAGNNGTDQAAQPTYPCSSPAANVVCVGASDQDDRVLPASNTGTEAVDLFAPGAQILTDVLGGREAYDDGSSMAAAFVSGAAALLLAADPSLSTVQLKAVLLDSADRRPGLAASVTGGRLNAAAALAAIGATPRPTGAAKPAAAAPPRAEAATPPATRTRVTSASRSRQRAGR
jgi:hypothetical protein